MLIEETAQKLIALRGNKSQCEVASSLKISVSALSMYETGQRIPRDETKIKLAEYYGTTVESLFFSPFNSTKCDKNGKQNETKSG